MLYLVPTPLGNLKDITLRSLEVLNLVELILCEDTRTSSKLLQHYNIQKPLTPYHQHNEHKIVLHLADQLEAGKTMALITDAGHTVLEPGTVTCLGIGPDEEGKIDRISGKLKMM